jgi:tRNA-specific 2-thiouridylase
MKEVLLAMSGGVDSSVAAALLKERGYTVMGATMRIWDAETVPGEVGHRGCCGPEKERDVENARKVAEALGIPFRVIDLKKEFKSQVLDYCRLEYLSGRTPNPCVRCNRKVKFDALGAKARDSGIEFGYFATGHYARVEYDESRHRHLLKKGRDLSKDQSYFLFSLSQKQLGRSLFPVGDYTKEQVKEMASSLGLDVNHRRESQDFIAAGYASLMKDRVERGPIVDRRGDVLGRHEGIQFYTIGQRKGLGISAREALYVVDIDAGKSTIVAGRKDELYRDECTASDLNWMADRPTQPMRAKARIRYLHREAEATITPLDEGRVSVRFEQPQMAITPGQAVVFYDGEVVIGGGTIETHRR